MDINTNYSEEENPLTLKSDFILSMCELIVGGKDGLQPVEKTIIDRSVRMVYQEFLADPKPEKMPILEDLYNILRNQKEPEAQRIATALEIYVHGSLNVFNHRTNVDVNNRFVCYDIRELGKQLKKLGMLIVQDQVWNRVTINRAQHKATRYYMDEFHLLLKEEQTAAYSVEIWKRFRKWGGIPTGITQNVKDLLSSREVENIFENSDFVYMLNQASGDRQILAKQLNISLRAYFELDFWEFVQRRKALRQRKEEIIEAFILSRKLFSAEYFESLHKRAYRRELKGLEALKRKLARRAYYVESLVDEPKKV